MEQDRSKEPRLNDLRPEEVKVILQESILRNYPNPERKGCPGTAVLNEMAKAHLPFEHREWPHVTHCSPCYGEFLARRHTLLKQRRLRHRVTQVAAGAALLVLASGSWLMWKNHTRPPSLPSVPSAEIQTQQQANSPSGRSALEVVVDIQSATPVRGATSQSRTVSVRVPVRLVQLRMKLPLGSADGRYDVQIRRSFKGRALRTAHGNACRTNGDTWLEFELDFSELTEGNYLLLYRHGRASWHPVLISVTNPS